MRSRATTHRATPAYGLTSIVKSTDAGETWRATGGGSVANQDGWGGALAVDPRHPTTVYASIGRTLVRTTDAGASWQPITQGLLQQVVIALTVDPKHPESVYAGLYPTCSKRVISATGGIYKTTNRRDSWTQVFPGTTPGPFTPGSLAVDPARPTTIYAVVNGPKAELARSTDAGRTWTTAPWQLHPTVGSSSGSRFALDRERRDRRRVRRLVRRRAHPLAAA